MKVFKKERSSNANNEAMFIQMQKELQIQKALVKQYKEAIYMMFYNSQDSRNSLDNVISLKSTGNQILMQEINNIIDSDTRLVVYIYLRNKAVNEMTNKIETNIINIAEILLGWGNRYGNTWYFSTFMFEYNGNLYLTNCNLYKVLLPVIAIMGS